MAEAAQEDKYGLYVPAPDGAIYVCGACGKVSPTQAPSKDSSWDWDESCMLNAVLCDKSSLRFSGARVIAAEAYKPTPSPGTDTTPPTNQEREHENEN